MDNADGFDWHGLMRVGMRGLGLRPAEFWALTPAELALMLGVERGAGIMTRSRLEEIAARFPDAARPPAPFDEMRDPDDGQEWV